MITVGIVSPARWLDPGALRAACGALESAGIDTAIPDQNFLREGQFAGNDEKRAEALHSLYEDERVDAILCARGGFGSTRILEYINFDLISANPKPLIGYSDITGLLSTIESNTKSPVWHGPMLTDIAQGLDKRSFERLLEVIRGDAGALPDIELTSLREGNGEGPLVGGNLSVLASLCGTQFQLKTTKKILFIEDVDEPAYVIDRLVLQIKQAGMLDRLEGLILGNFSDISDTGEFGSGVEEIVLDHCSDTGFPILTGIPLGHNGPNLAVRLGASFGYAA
ncbi:MAG: LD-carboxypeptidase [Gammaproteobacteria bacterium]|nr:LD-carboxypeptidase [Gammaproteobacteria bacterium]